MNNSRLSPVKIKVVGKLLPAILFSITAFQSVAVADTNYGPVRSGETLSSIVNENYLISPFSDQIIMQEILRKNSDAFISNKMGLLRQGVMLILPSDQTIAASLPVSATRTELPAVRNVVTSSPVNQNNELITSLEEKLTLVRDERDRANEKLRQLELETVNLKSRVSELESDNARLSEELKAADVALNAARSELEELQTKFKNNRNVAQSEVDNTNKTKEGQSVLLSERAQRIEALEASIAELQDSQASELLALKATLDAKNTEQQLLEGKVKSFTDSAKLFETRIDELKKKNESLVVELALSKTAYDRLKTSESSEAPLVVSDSTGLNSTSGTSKNSFSIKDVSTQNLSSQLEKSVTFPLWSLLLGVLALGLTTVLMFLARGRAARTTLVPDVLFDDPDAAQSNDVVFRAADPARVEPDIETLRVPPRRDPSRVAILDPTMNEQLIPVGSPSIVNESSLTNHQLRESELKLAMAEAYGEIGDLQAANELLNEVQKEGSQKQSASAQILLNRLLV